MRGPSPNAGEHQLRDMEGWVRDPCPVADSKEKPGSPISRNRIVFLHPPELRGNRKTRSRGSQRVGSAKGPCVPWWVHDYYFFSSQPTLTCSHLGKIFTEGMTWRKVGGHQKRFISNRHSIQYVAKRSDGYSTLSPHQGHWTGVSLESFDDLVGLIGKLKGSATVNS